MKQVIGVFVGLCVTLQVTAQPNLVPNPSFEAFIDCPNTGGDVEVAEPWSGFYGSVDFFHQCGSGGFGMPTNWNGFQQPRTGLGYIGVKTESISVAANNPLFINSREFAGVPLLSPLQPNQSYRVEFYVSLADVQQYAIKNIGAYLSQAEPPSEISQLLSLYPQVKHDGIDFLSDKEGWMRIVGFFTALGGENFITIGNFDTDENTDTLLVDAEATHPWSYYYIDDVSVTPADSLVGMADQLPMGNKQLSIYPNPATEYLTIVTGQGGGTLRLLDMAGREVLSMPLHSPKHNISVEGIPAGMYVATMEQQGTVVGRRKVLVE